MIASKFTGEKNACFRDVCSAQSVCNGSTAECVSQLRHDIAVDPVVFGFTSHVVYTEIVTWFQKSFVTCVHQYSQLVMSCPLCFHSYSLRILSEKATLGVTAVHARYQISIYSLFELDCLELHVSAWLTHETKKKGSLDRSSSLISSMINQREENTTPGL